VILTDQEKQWLTEGDKNNKMLGECWHEFTGQSGYACKKCYKRSMSGCVTNRTFDTWQDFGDVVRGMGIIELADVLVELTPKDSCYQVARLLQSYDFIERFMRAVVEMKGGVNERRK
jgi:hypothetical protein